MYELDTEFAREHLSVDFSPESENREQIKRAIGARIEAAPRHEGSQTMKRTWKTGTKMILASAMAVVLLSASAFAITKTLNLGPFAKYVQEAQPEQSAREIFEEHRADWQGKVFDGTGKAIDDLAAYAQTGLDIYDAAGRIAVLDWIDDGFIVKPKGSGTDSSAHAEFRTLEEVASYLSFTPKLPQAIPAGYALDRFELFREEDGSLPEAGKGKYLSVHYAMNGNKDRYIYLQLRLMDSETGYVDSGDEASREITINGNTAMTDGQNIDMLVGDVMYMFKVGKAGVSYDEVLKMAESVK